MKPMDSQDFAEKIWESLNRNIQDFAQMTNIGSQALTFRGEIERRPIDQGNPREAG